MIIDNSILEIIQEEPHRLEIGDDEIHLKLNKEGFEHFLPTQVVVLCFNFVGTCFNIVSTCLVESKAEVLKDVGKLLAQIVGILDGVH